MTRSCDSLAKILVDYADGQLSAEQLSMVAEHLAGCGDCRRLVEGLRRSLELAEVIWQDGVNEIDGIRLVRPGRAVRHSWRRYAAAAILVVSAIFITSHMINKPAKDQPTLAEIERKITEAGDAARLLAAVDLLAAYSDTETVKQQYRRIVETYPHTPAAAKAKLQIE